MEGRRYTPDTSSYEVRSHTKDRTSPGSHPKVFVSLSFRHLPRKGGTDRVSPKTSVVIGSRKDPVGWWERNTDYV